MSSRSVPPLPSGAPSPARLRQIVDFLGEGVAILSADGVVEYLNPRAEELLHVSAEEVLGERLLELRWSIRDGAGNPLPREAHPALRVLETGEPSPPMTLGMSAPSVEGATVWFEVSSTPLPPESGEGRPGSLSTFRDVTARVVAERALVGSQRRFDSLLEALPVAVFHVRDGLCVRINRAWTEITGRGEEDSLGEGWVDAIHPADQERVQAEWEDAVERGVACNLEHRVLRPDGEVRWVMCRMRELTEEADGATGMLGSAVDVTDARAAGELKNQVIGLVSHELRTPLISILGGLSFLESYMAEAGPDERRLYEIAVRNAELLERLVTDLLDIERLEAGSVALDLQDTALGPLLEEAVELAQPRADERGVTVSLVPVPELIVALDRDRILQVLTNLLSNAIKFSEPGAAVRVEVRAEDGGVAFSVVDQGRGVPPEDTERIFERFVQVLPSDAADRGGSGLGLAIARAIVARHQGRIWVESSEGEGSTFHFFLPHDR